MRLGTYAVEQDYSHYVQKASDIVFAVVGTATKGPINKPTICTSPADLVNKFGPLNPTCLGLYAGAYFLNKGNKLWFVRAAGTSAKSAVADMTVGVGNAQPFELRAKYPGTYANGWTYLVETEFDEPDPNDNYGNTTFILKDANGTTLEVFSTTPEYTALYQIVRDSKYVDVYVQEDFESDNPKWFKLTPDYKSPIHPNIFVKYNEIQPGYTEETKVRAFKDGDDGYTNADYITAGKSLESDLIDMNLFAIPGVSDNTVVTAMIQLAETRADCLYLVDAPKDLTPGAVSDWHNGSGVYTYTKYNSSYAALYYAWQRIYDSHNKIYVEVPPSVVVAPVFARSQELSEVWYAPAGLKRGLLSGVTAPVYSPTTGEMNLLYTGDNSINCIVEDPQAGLCIMGQKTLLREDSALNRVNVRMLLNYLKRVITAACRHLTFEPNDRVTWNNFEDLIEPVLKSIKSRRGITEYKIVKGESIVTTEDIENYRMPCKIMIKPTKSAEEIPIYFTITNVGADFNDVLENDGIYIEQ